MTIRPILTAPDPRLQAVSMDVETVDADIRTLVDDQIPLNAGCLKPLEIRVPEGALLAPAFGLDYCDRATPPAPEVE